MKKGIDLEENEAQKLELQLYISGMSPRSMEAIANIKRLCENKLKNAFNLEVIDLYKNPEAAIEQQIIFCPTLVKTFPLPKKSLIGTFSDSEKVMKSLGINVKSGL